jgi:putative nucleotidyltransferase with HDIG domain
MNKSIKEQIPDTIIQINNNFREAGFEIYLVGGCVRNMLLGKEVKDWDFTTNATPEQILSLFPQGFYDNIFGTVGIPIEITPGNKQVVEITTFRTERGYKDRRHPEIIEWGKTIEEDLARRDFTINAMAIAIDDKLQTKLIDPYNGQHDLEQKIIKAVGDPNLRFKEDALRMLRAIRFATELGFSIEEKTLQAIISDAHLIQEIAMERIRDEFMKIIASPYPYEGILLLKNTGLLKYIIPELLEGIGVSQARPGRHHTTDVFEHNVASLKFCPSSDPIVRFATLIHDIGKPRVARKDEQGYIIFHNHEIVGAKMAAEICDRLRFSRKDKEKVVTLVRWHMFTVDEHITDSAVRRFIRRVGVENVKDMMDLRIGDRLGGGTQTAESWRLKLFKKRVEEQLAPPPFSLRDLAVDGKDVMRELNIKPGPKVGKILQKLFEEVDEDLSKNNREYLLQRIRELGRSEL